MKVKNRYMKRSKISEAKFRAILRLFAIDLTARQISDITRINRNTINRIFKAIRSRIVEYCEQENPLTGEIEVDESWFGGHQKGPRGRGALKKKIVFGILSRGGNIYTKIVNDCSKSTLHTIIVKKVVPCSKIISDEWKGYYGLAELGYNHECKIKHSEGQYVSGTSHINGIEGFWGLAKVRLAKFRGMNHNTFSLHLKECEFRFNNRTFDLYKILLRLFKENPLI
ncbi:MAG TPA: IS1595 family transposase [Candidatus Bathyarchaeia archaeon]|nr:IS1595 family transposase [Candidatus Bathyarchaeia archaeon]